MSHALVESAAVLRMQGRAPAPVLTVDGGLDRTECRDCTGVAHVRRTQRDVVTWLIVDYKTDVDSDAAVANRLRRRSARGGGSSKNPFRPRSCRREQSVRARSAEGQAIGRALTRAADAASAEAPSQTARSPRRWSATACRDGSTRRKAGNPYSSPAARADGRC